MGTINILGYSINNSDLKGAIDLAWRSMQSGGHQCCVATANPHALVMASQDGLFAQALKNAEILLPDGAGIVLAAKVLNQSLPERVAGTEFFLELTRRADERGTMGCFFLGSSESVLGQIVERLRKDFPTVRVCGTHSPPFKETFYEQDTLEMVKRVNAAAPDMLWVGMTAPKQEKWVYANRNSLDVPFIGSIGAVFDFYAGTKKRAPGWVRDMGLEWLPRFIREPRRLGRRVFVSTPAFVAMVMKQKFSD